MAKYNTFDKTTAGKCYAEYVKLKKRGGSLMELYCGDSSIKHARLENAISGLLSPLNDQLSKVSDPIRKVLIMKQIEQKREWAKRNEYLLVPENKHGEKSGGGFSLENVVKPMIDEINRIIGEFEKGNTPVSNYLDVNKVKSDFYKKQTI